MKEWSQVCLVYSLRQPRRINTDYSILTKLKEIVAEGFPLFIWQHEGITAILSPVTTDSLLDMFLLLDPRNTRNHLSTDSKEGHFHRKLG